MYLLPVPKEVVYHEGVYALPHDGQIVLDASCEGQTYEYALLLKEELEACGMHAAIQREGAYLAPGSAVRRGRTLPCGVQKKETAAAVRLCVQADMQEQHYILEITKEGITVTAGGSDGVLYGVQTLRQIIRQEGMMLPCLKITDGPDFAVRGFYHDITRGRVPKMEWLKQLADTLSFYKINQLQLYIEHTYLFSGMSELWRDDTPLTAEDILELDRYCQKRGVELVPSLSTFGHLYKLLSTKQYRAYCELSDAGQQPFGLKARLEHHTIDVSSDEALRLICGMIAEFLPLFSSHHFNICADETFDLGRGKNQERAKREGKDRLYIDYVKKLCAFVIEQGSTPMLWGDVLLGFPELASELPKEAICLNWGYAPDQSEDSTKTYAETGVRQYVCPGVGGWNQFINLQWSAYQNISRMSSYGMKYGCEGILNTDWGDFGHINHPTFSIPGIICGAAASWNRAALPEYEELNRQISALEYADASESLMELTGTLAVQESFSWHDAVFLKECWDAAGAETVREELEKSREKLETAPEKNEKIAQCVRGLKRCTKTMDREMRNTVYPYLIAAEAMEIFNTIGLLVLNAACGKAASDADGAAQAAYDAAEALETWYYRYRLLWQTVSRESELYRVGEVIFWYADTLRERVAKNTW